MTLVEDKAHLRRRRNYLAGIADAALADLDAAEARKVELSKAEAAAEVRRKELVAEKDRLAAARLKAVHEAEEAARGLVRAMERVHAMAAAECSVATELGLSAMGLRHEAVARRFGRYLSAMLRSLPGSTQSRYGEMGLARLFRPAASWAAAEERALGASNGKESKEDVD